MLEAVARGKASFERLTGGEGRQPREDLITSAVFGNLRLLQNAGHALDLLLGDLPTGQDRLRDSTDVTLELWKRLGACEPDVIVTCRFPGRSLRILVEVKWGAPLGDRQLSKYVSALRAGGLAPDLVFLLGKEAWHQDALDEERDKGLVIYERSWRDVSRSVRTLSRVDSPEGRWARQVHDFLQGSDRGRSFAGISRLLTKPVGDVPWSFSESARSWFRGVSEVIDAQFHFTRGE